MLKNKEKKWQKLLKETKLILEDIDKVLDDTVPHSDIENSTCPNCKIYYCIEKHLRQLEKDWE